MDDKSQRIFIKGAINTSSITPTPVASSNITPTSIVVVTVMAVTSNAVLDLLQIAVVIAVGIRAENLRTDLGLSYIAEIIVCERIIKAVMRYRFQAIIVIGVTVADRLIVLRGQCRNIIPSQN